MIVQLHTSTGITDYELTIDERQSLADIGNLEARLEIAQEEISAHTSPFEHIETIYKVFGIVYPPP